MNSLLDSKNRLLCPVCGQNHAHIRRLTLAEDRENREILTLKLAITVNAGHQWTLDLSQYKGRLAFETGPGEQELLKCAINALGPKR
jgi:hypothetical protein